MVVADFLRWLESAKVAERAAAAAALSRAFISSDLPFEDRCAAEAALTLLLDDPSSKVRAAMAEALSMSRLAPPQIVAALASDQADVAAMIVARSPLLSDVDLIDRVAEGHGSTQRLIARRSRVSMSLAASIAEIGEEEACLALLDNSGADIAPLSLRRMAERFGHVGRVREALTHNERLPADSRHLLVTRVGEALLESPFIRGTIGASFAEKVTRNACIKAGLTLVERTSQAEYPALIEHIRLRGELSAGFLVRIIAHGKVDFFGAALVALTGQAQTRVRSLLADGFDTALCALFGKAGLSRAIHSVILCALKVWRAVARGKRVAGAQEVSWLMLGAIGGDKAQGELASLLKSIHLDALRANARGHAMAIAAAA
ncbi:DUF2336 domain-containing protein [Salmonella enterica subsp. enterica]|nr:DUF2336 domain-containing protein [Escherichia coli]MIL09861.1 DUF2336 domain-containing protein [Salmonella enterica subsp. enterica serovar Enteritidis]